MRDIDLYAQILNIQAPWTVEDVELDQAGGEVRVHVTRDEAAPLECPQCHQAVPGCDTRQRQWRHLDTCQLRTLLVADVPRVNCPEHGVQQIQVPWAEEGSRFTALFEALVIGWLQEASIQAVSQRLGLSWDAVDGIMQRAVKRGLARRDPVASTALAVDEKAYKKWHNYLTVVSDGHRVLHVAEERREDSLGAFCETLTPEQKRRIRWVSMGMWAPYIRATTRHLPHGARKTAAQCRRSKRRGGGALAHIAFDRFHVAKQFNEAVDLLRRKEYKALAQEGDHRLKNTKYHWLRGGGPRKEAEQERFDQLRQQELRTARAWAMKEMAADLWDYRDRDSARTAWYRLLGWVARSRLQPMVKLGQTVRNHLSGILNAVMAGASNSLAENLNNRIQKIKARANGFRNRQRMINAIYFHLGGLNLYPAKATLRN